MVCNGKTPGFGLPRAREKNEKGDNSGSWVLAGDASSRDWCRRRRVLPAVGLAAATLVVGILVAREKGGRVLLVK